MDHWIVILLEQLNAGLAKEGIRCQLMAIVVHKLLQRKIAAYQKWLQTANHMHGTALNLVISDDEVKNAVGMVNSGNKWIK